MVESILSGKIALITGAASGIGQAAAFVFVRHGAKVVLVDINEAAGEGTAQRIRDEGGDASFIRADVTNEGEVEAMVREAASRHGKIDCAFNNAGIFGAIAPTADCTSEGWDRVTTINLKSVWLSMKYEIAQMLKQGGGAIVNNASVFGLVGFPGLPAYTASKHGIVGLTRAAALEYIKAGVRVNAICAGVIDTPLAHAILATGRVSMDQALAIQPIGRMGRPQEVAEAAAWLCSDLASLVVGHALAVDGGCSAQ
jgi:NAD(P)-dependent dehydrogenase (short-subunit alcohol dehydrogenase family)